MKTFNAELELQRLQTETDMIRQRTIRKSKLVKYTKEITELWEREATIAEIHRWLKYKKKVDITVSSVRRFIGNHIKIDGIQS